MDAKQVQVLNVGYHKPPSRRVIHSIREYVYIYQGCPNNSEDRFYTCLSIKSLADNFSCGLISQVFKNRSKFLK